MNPLDWVNLALHIANSLLICCTTLVEIVFIVVTTIVLWLMHRQISSAIVEMRSTIRRRQTFQWIIDEIKGTVDNVATGIKKKFPQAAQGGGWIDKVIGYASQYDPKGPKKDPRTIGQGPRAQPRQVNQPPIADEDLAARRIKWLNSLSPEQRNEFEAVK